MNYVLIIVDIFFFFFIRNATIILIKIFTGALFSGASIVDTCAQLLGGIVFTQIYAHSAFAFPGLTFLIAAIAIVIAIVFLM